MRVLRVGWLLARPAAAGRAALMLPVAAFAITTALALTVLAGAGVFFRWHDQAAIGYQFLAVIALTLLVVPLASLGGSAARLSARRRDDRLSTLRLLGASAGTVTALTALEAAAVAMIGAIAGVAVYAAAVPAVGFIPFRGAPLGAGQLWLPPLTVAAVVAAVGAVAALSALVGLRCVIISPLGVRTRQNAPRMHWARVAVAVAVVAGTVVAIRFVPSARSVVMVAAVLAAGFGAVIAVLNLAGPFVLRLVARGQARRATTAVRLIAARSVLESPRAAWRQVGGVAMVSFVAVFAGTGLAIASLGAGSSASASDVQLLTDIRTGVLITVVASFLMVACSVGVSQAASILERRDLYRGLDLLGMPARQLDAARRRAVMSPLILVTLGSALCAVAVILPLAGMALVFAPLSMATIAVCLLGGILIVRVALAATRPILTRARR